MHPALELAVELNDFIYSVREKIPKDSEMDKKAIILQQKYQAYLLEQWRPESGLET